MTQIRAARSAMYAAEAAEAQRVAAEIEAQNKAQRCHCPICDTGLITVDLAERVYRALERLPSDSKPDPAVIQALVAAAQGIAAPATARFPRITADVKHPRRVEADRGPDTAPAGTPTSKRPIPSSEISEDEFTQDGALIEP